jgi:hypothetical protein
VAAGTSEPKKAPDADELYEKLEPFKQRVSEDIRRHGDDEYARVRFASEFEVRVLLVEARGSVTSRRRISSTPAGMASAVA